MKQLIIATIGLLTVGLLLLGGIFLFTRDKLFGGAAPGTASSVGTSSQFVLRQNSSSMIFATTTSCVARVITTKEAAIRLTFTAVGDFASPTPTFGYVQLASTTVLYDAEQYGCGMTAGISAGDDDTIISVMEMQ